MRNSTASPQPTTLDGSGSVRVYSQDGALVSETEASGAISLILPAQGFAVLIG